MHKSRNNGNAIKNFLLHNLSILYKNDNWNKKILDFKLDISDGFRPWYVILSPFFPFAYCLPALPWVCAFREFAVRSSYVHLSVLGSPIRSFRANRSSKAHRLLTARSLCTEQPFIVRSAFRFDSSPLPFDTPMWIYHLRKQNKNGSLFLITTKYSLKQNESLFNNSTKAIGS